MALPGVDGIKAFRAVLKAAVRHYGLCAIDVREIHARNEDEPPRSSSLSTPTAQTREVSMSAFSDRVRGQKKGFFKVADLEGGKEITLTISHLDEEMEMFGKTVDILNFVETGQQLQLNQTTAEWLLDNLGDDPKKYPGKRITLYLAEYEYNREKKFGIRLKLPGQPSPATNGPPQQPKALPPRKQDLDDEIPF